MDDLDRLRAAASANRDALSDKETAKKILAEQLAKKHVSAWVRVIEKCIAAKETSIICCFTLEFGMFNRRIYRWFSPGSFLERHIRPDINLHELMAADVELYCKLLTKELGSPFRVDYRPGSVGSDLYCLTLYL